MLPPHALNNPGRVRRFEREARAAGRLHHTNIVPVFGVGREGDVHYYVMQYIQGQPLSEVLAELRRLRQGAGAGATGAGTRPNAAAADPIEPPTAAEVARSLWAGAFAATAGPDSTDALPPTADEPKGPSSPAPAPVAGDSRPGSNALIRSAAPAHSGRRYARTVARLGAQAAEALDYAAQQGVLHRDVKPSNLLLDVRGTLWVTDFGLAKLSDAEDLTHTGDILGTLRYMAPERFRGQSDVRSDVYGLGLTLYELLALRPAFEEADRSRLLDLVTRSEPAHLLKLDPSIPRDLATIVHKAIARDPSDRYPSAGELAADLTRFLEDRPIRARRLSLFGVAWRWARRNKAVAGLLGLVAALVVVLWTNAMIAAERHRAVAQKEGQARSLADAQAQEATRARIDADANAARADAARAEADQSAAEARAVVTFVTDHVLRAATPSRTRGKAVTVLEALANADRSLEGKFAKEPRVEASVRESLAQVYTELGEYQKAQAHAARAFALREKALGPEHDATLSAMQTLGWTYYRLQKLDRSERGEALYRRMLEICRRTRGEEAELTLEAMNGLAVILDWRSESMAASTDPAATRALWNRIDEAATLHRRILGIRRRTKGPEAPETLGAMNNQAISLMGMGKLKEAEPLLREVVQAGVKNKPDDPDSLLAMSNYTSLMSRLSRTEDAADWAMRSMDAHLRVLKLKHPRTQDAVKMAVTMKSADRKFGEALAIADRALEQAWREFGPDDSITMEYMDMRVGVLLRQGELAKARSSAEDVLAARTRWLGPEDPKTLDALGSLAMIRRHQGATEEARTLFTRLREAARRALDSSEKKPIDPYQSLKLSGRMKWAEVLARNLSRPGRLEWSELPPGAPGGPPRIDATFRGKSPVADGRIEPGEYGDGDGFAFDFTRDPNPGGSYLSYIDAAAIQATKAHSDLSVRMHAAHTATGLFLAFRVRDQSVWAHPEGAFATWLNDGVEVFLDGDRVANDFTPVGPGNCEGFPIGADVLGNHQNTSVPGVGDVRWKVGTGRTEDGYVIEFEIPLDLIDTEDGPGYRPATAGSELRINVGINDIDQAINKKASYGVLWCEDRFWSPAHGGEDFWPVALRLVPAPTPDR